ncbi:ficolin-1-like [Apostichopus japonicus]|uniref:ficolin-1-like n=1 Tax=Stichopus japonicus TaxID=307972 RepID=UPI003AB3F314
MHHLWTVFMCFGSFLPMMYGLSNILPNELGDTCIHEIPRDCSDIKHCIDTTRNQSPTSGVYTIQPSTYSQPFYVYCDMDTDGGGWTVFQKRLDGSVGFYNGWSSYKYGFGNINSEYWLGNEKLFYLTAQSNYELRVDLSDFEGNERYARYDSFRLGDEATYYELLLGAYSGNAGDSLGALRGMSFSTKDADHDLAGGGSCAKTHKGAWWYTACYQQGSNLNGLYHGGPYTSFQDGVVWLSWHGYTYSLKTTAMKVRRLNPF